MGGIDFLAFDPVKDLEQSIDLLLKEAIALRQLFDDAVFFVGRLDG